MSSVLDIIGPVMIGPSSSHTAGAVRLGRVARALLGQDPVRATITLYGSFAKTYLGHGTDRALVAGIMGFATDDTNIRCALEMARDRGLEVTFKTSEATSANGTAMHPNMARIALEGASQAHVEVVGASVGGGKILVTQIDGLSVHVSAQRLTFVVLHNDVPGLIAAVTDVLAEAGANICDFSLARERRGGNAVMTIECEGELKDGVVQKILALDDVSAAIMLMPV